MSGDLAYQALPPQTTGGEQQHFAVLLQVLHVGDHMPTPVLLPHLGVAYTVDVTIREQQHQPQLVEGAIDIFRHQALPGGTFAVGKFYVVDAAQGQGALEPNRTVGVTIAAIILSIRRQGDRFISSMQQIG